jgi:hypothetical protein
MEPGLIVLFVVLGIVLLIVLWYIGTMNRLRQVDLKVQEAESESTLP